MSHELETYGELASFVSAREPAWHKLGTVLDSTFDAATALKTAHLAGWNVRKSPLTTVDDDGNVLQVPGKFANIRTNPFDGSTDVLGTSGSKYTPIQNEDHVDLLDTLVDESGAHLETAGSLRGGREVFVTMAMPDSMWIGGVDEVKTYISALNSHDGESSFKFVVGPVRVVCANTQAAAIAQAKSMFSVRHTANHKQSIATARDALGLTFKYIDGFQQEAEKMIQESLTEAAFYDIVKDLMGDPDKQKGAAKTTLVRKQDDLMELFTSSPTATQIKGTRWAGYQAVTEWVDFFSPVRGAKGDVQEARAVRAIGESGLNLKTKAFQLLSV
ncbi:hypothetical protein SEA_MUFASA8_100 [Arthrobacter phage Mufasa8]|uniref:Uncharacterized protein n=1 Tax=Arthrobacter phage Mufasa8 TaxID=2656526 RepID=A0A649VMC1_9CAUD|nr:hypothetical protein HYQ08_gp100 [Arthrobacter phage Mufasa8]QGJ93547.1 hypothetical protein SEA_MUFASA8_100 [Arthrobacter phage Mufasa8]